MHYPYEYEHGERLTIAPIKATPLFHDLRKSRSPIAGSTPEVMERFGVPSLPGSDTSKSLVTAPIIAGDKVIGSIIVENFERHNAFGESDVRLIQTIAASMGVALENARLFDETQRLLRETEQRNAELAIINSVQSGLASKLDMRAIYDLVGDKLSEVMNTLDIDIRLFSPETNQVLFPYMRDQGQRIEIAPIPMLGISKHVFETRQTLIINERMAERMEEFGSILVPGTQMEKSFLAVPILVGERALGMVSTSNYEKENAFGDAEVRLLQTVVSAMSVALENARLFDETQRLLKETEQRATELQIINSVQQGLASKLETQAIYELVGEKLRELFEDHAISLVTFDVKRNIHHYQYIIEKGQRLDVPDSSITPMGQYIIRTRQTLLVNERIIENLAELGIAFPF
jgi:GAF domain-containing protein